MISETIKPRFLETDALGHINNTVVPGWFEGARDPVFRWFMNIQWSCAATSAVSVIHHSIYIRRPGNMERSALRALRLLFILTIGKKQHFRYQQRFAA